MPITKRRLGYGGSGEIAGVQVLITGGSLESNLSVSYLNMISTPPSSAPAGRVEHASGTQNYSGSLNFDVHDAALDIFKVSGGLLERNYSFDVGINDGTNAYKMSGCKVTSLNLAGTVGGIVTAQLSFVSKTTRVLDGSVKNAFIRDTAEPIGYWYTGVTDSDIKDWSLSMSQDASLVYTNEDTIEPAYIKIGLVSYALTVSSYKVLVAPATINIATKAFTLIGNTVGSGFSYGGVTDVGSYDYTFETSSNTGYSSLQVIS